MERTALYRHFDKDGVLLYVGISKNVPARTGAHCNGSPWFSEVTTIGVEWFATRSAALEAERIAVVSENPVHNQALRVMPLRPVMTLPAGTLNLPVTPNAISGLAPLEGRSQTIYRDRLVRGLGLRVGVRTKKWVVDYRDSAGTRKLETLGKYPTVGLRAARNAARSKIHQPSNQP